MKRFLKTAEGQRGKGAEARPRWSPFLLFSFAPLLALLAFTAPAQQASELFTLYTTYTPGDLPAAGVSFSDDFNRADAADLGTNWAVLAGSMALSNNQAFQMTLNYSNILVSYVTNTATVSQYAKVTLDGSLALETGIYPQLLLRVNGTNGAYGVEWKPNEDLIEWDYYTNSASPAVQIGSASATIATNDVVGVTITGTGASTTVRVWVNPTGLPSAADNWDGDTTPTVTFTDDPVVAADVGQGIGLAAFGSDPGHIQFNDFFGGDIP